MTNRSRMFGLAQQVSVAILAALLIAAAPGEAAQADKPQPAHPILQPSELAFEEIIFVKRRPYSSDHYYTDINNGTSGDRFDARNGIFIFNLRTRKERPVVTAAQMPGGKGFIGKITLSFDAKKVLFDFRENPGAGFRVWEVGVDGQGLRQVSKPPPDEEAKAARWHKGWHTDDIHPAYLSDGRIIFSSSRCEHTVLCGGSAHLTVPTLHRMKADGSEVEQLSRSPVSEFCPVVLDDGRVMYHRWEYVDKGARVSKTLWSMNPDGSCPQEMFGLSDDATPVYMYPQPLPGSTSRLVCVGTCHFPQGGCLGSILLVDCDTGSRVPGPDPDESGFVPLDPAYPVVNITPHVFVERRTEPGWHFRTPDGKYVHDRDGRKGNLYTHPFPVTDKRFLVSYKVKGEDHYKNVPNAYALYLLDVDGTHRFIHADPDLSCWHPTPLAPRPVPPQVECEQRNPAFAATGQAVCVLADIYRGMDGVQRGEVKWIRVNEVLPRYWSTGRRWNPSLSSSSWKGALWPRVQWGVAPVESDGSAHFLVPAKRNIFFQALDKDFREIQRERTYVNYAPGEVRSCTGCHGQANFTSTAVRAAKPIALARPPSSLQAQPCDLKANGGDDKPGQAIHYPTDIQPLLDAKCVKCHGEKDPPAKLRLTGEITTYYSTSYEELSKRELAGPLISEFTSWSKGDQGNWNGAYLPPKSLGSYKSKLMAMLSDPKHPQNAKNNHSKLLTSMELMRMARWIDSNYQFYGSYFGRHHPQWAKPETKSDAYDPADFRRRATFEESVGFLAPAWHR